MAENSDILQNNDVNPLPKEKPMKMSISIDEDEDDDSFTVLPAITISPTQEEETKNVDESTLVYKISDSVPFHLMLLFGFQVYITTYKYNTGKTTWVTSPSLITALLAAEAVCAEDNEDFKAKLLSSTLFMNGVTTFLMVTLGVRIPVYQGANPDYVVPLLAMANIEKDRCKGTKPITVFNNITGTNSAEFPEGSEEIILESIQTLQGSLMAACAIHTLIGATGLVGILMKYIGPVTLVPVMLLSLMYLMKSITKYAQVHWGLSFMVCAVAIILSLYLAKVDTPLPIWSKEKKCHVIRYPLHQVFALLIAFMVGWCVCGILTETGVFSTDKDHKDFYSRTDARSDVIRKASWFYFPYPGQFGQFKFSVSVFVGFFIATILSMLSSIGNYYVSATVCKVPPPPVHSVNRGVAIEGFCGVLAGAIGCGHATAAYGTCSGVIGLTKVASRWVFVAIASIYIVFGLIAKVSAIFITVPYPVLGGTLIVMAGIVIGITLSNLKSVDLSSSRNLTIIGTSLLVGLMIPHWIEEYEDGVDTGNKEANDVIRSLLGNPNLSGGVLACFLDNTVPGTREERGIAAWENPIVKSQSAFGDFSEGYDVYNPPFIDKFSSSKILRFLPFLPYHLDTPLKRLRSLSRDFGRRLSLVGAPAVVSSH